LYKDSPKRKSIDKTIDYFHEEIIIRIESIKLELEKVEEKLLNRIKDIEKNEKE
jgi:hypothetical protein